MDRQTGSEVYRALLPPFELLSGGFLTSKLVDLRTGKHDSMHLKSWEMRRRIFPGQFVNVSDLNCHQNLQDKNKSTVVIQ